MMKITPVLIMDSIERSLPFWVDRIGFEKIAEVPDGEGLGFVMLSKGAAELMLQTIESVRKDEPKFVPSGPANGVSLYIEVDDFADMVKRLDGYAIEMPERTTFYGMREIGVRDPEGRVVVFGARAEGSQ